MLLVHGDQQSTLTQTCREQVEAEANYAAGRLLFLQDRFVEEVRCSDTCFKNIQKLNKTYGNTLTATLWRTVEALQVPAFGLVSIHPQARVEVGNQAVRRFVKSNQFFERFPHVTPGELFNELGKFCFGRRGPIGSGSVLIEDANMDNCVFTVESFYNGYDALTLGIFHK